MAGSAYDQAVELSGRGPTVVINLPDTLMVWCTPLDRVSPVLRHEPFDPDRMQRARFWVAYATRVAALGDVPGDSRERA